MEHEQPDVVETWAQAPRFIHTILGAIGEISVDEAWVAICREWATVKAQQHARELAEARQQIRTGDRLSISAELISDFHSQPGHRSPLVVLVEVRCEADGSKTLMLQRVLEGKTEAAPWD